MTDTATPNISFGPNGFVAPTAADVFDGVFADWNAALGGDLNPALGTPQGQLISSAAALVVNGYDQQVVLFNGVDPAYASGRMQDAIGRVVPGGGFARIPAQATALQVACGGGNGVVIPFGALIQDPAGLKYTCTGGGVIPISGTITLGFAAVVLGATPVPGTVSISRTVPGWNTVAVVSGAVGQDMENRAAFEARRQASVSANGAGFLPALLGSVLSAPGVIDAYVTENYTGSPVTVGGVSLAANSLYVAVAGGASADVARAIWIKKPPGCAYTGNTTVTVYDNSSGYTPPYPSYAVTFQIPVGAAFCFRVTLQNSSRVPSNASAQIQAAIVSAFSGEDGAPRARIGSMVFASRFYSAVASLGSWAQIVSILLGTSLIPGATFTGSISATTLTVSSVTGTVVIGQFVYGPGVAAGTVITAGSGTTWTVSVSQTAASAAMSSVAASQNDVQMQINWLPTILAADILTVLV